MLSIGLFSMTGSCEVAGGVGEAAGALNRSSSEF